VRKGVKATVGRGKGRATVGRGHCSIRCSILGESRAVIEHWRLSIL
jgi:hypothetical protein